MIEMVKVTDVRALDERRLWVRFSNGQEGVRDFADIFAEGGVMVEPLRDPSMFRRVFLEFGAPSWPNGFDIDPIALYREMEAAGGLTQVAAE
jgi:Protein of unknown function (DUF2442)